MNYPFIKCLEPKYIHNNYNGEDMLVPCGKCEVCLMRKSSQNVLRVQMEHTQHLYCKFITLTYSEDYIPRMMLIENDAVTRRDCGHDFTLVDPDYGNVLGYWDNYTDYQSLCRKCNSYDVPFLRKYDLQLFFKRLRKYFSDYGKSNNIPVGKIRYFSCGEYGPLHFRPHYHIILWTSDDTINMEIGKAVSACWKFGRVSTETPFYDVSKYVAQYVNGSCPLPSILKLPETRPFSVHSLHLGEEFFALTKEEVYKASYKEIIERNLFVSNTYTEVSMWRSFKAYYFPKCKSYATFNTYQRHAAYTLIKELYKRFPRYEKESLSSFTEFILRYIERKYSMIEYIDDVLLKQVSDYIETDFFLMNSEVEKLRAYRSLYMVLRISKHFCDFVCDGNLSSYNTWSKLKMIEDFWKDDELHMMNKAYQNIEMDTNSYFENEDEYLLRYTLVPSLIKETKFYKKYKETRLRNYRDSMKHKKQNDLNRIFELI